MTAPPQAVGPGCFGSQARRARPARGLALAALLAASLALGPGPAAAGGVSAGLTAEERAWLAAHGPIVLTTEPAFPPIEWFDEGGAYQGMVADYLDLLQARLGASLEVRPSPTWAEALRRAQAREVDGLTAAQPTPERSAYLDWTPPLLEIPNVVVVRAGVAGDFSVAGLAGRRVAVTRGFAVHEQLGGASDATLVPLADDLACLKAVSFGEVDAAVVNLAVATWHIQAQGITNLRVADDTGHPNVLAIATRNDQPQLRAILAKGLATITPAEREAIQARWLHAQDDTYLSRRAALGWLGAAGGLALGMALLVLAWNRALRRRVALATGELQQELAERRRAEAALGASERKLALHLDQTAVGVLEFDAELRVVYWNPAAERIFGWSREEALGREGDFFLPPGERAGVHQVLRQVLDQTGGRHHVNRNLTRDGRTITCEWFNTALTDDGGRAVGVMSMGLDLSERERREEAQARAQRLESLAILAGGIAHDFNNLLTGILANVSLLREGGAAAAEEAELLAETEAAAGRAKALTRQLLTFARGGAPAKAPLDPGPLVREAARFASRGAAGTCRVELPATLWPVEADAGQLGQVVQNLVLNALEARPGGLVEVSLADVRRGPPAQPEGPCLRLRVTDHGPGIPPDQLGRIFDPFYSTKQRGSGLGLAVTHSIVARHGGQLEVHSTEGQGTTFEVWLPARPKLPTPAPAPAAPVAPVAPTPRRVLVMDDEAPIRLVAERALAAAGCEVAVAASGEEAVTLWRAGLEAGAPFDLALLDLTVPGGLGGVETLAALRALDPAARAVVSSGYSTAAVLADHRAHGFDAAITKPWTAEELRRVVASVARRGD